MVVRGGDGGGGGGALEVLGGEVGGIDLGGELGLEGGADAAQAVEVDAREEGVVLDLGGAGAAQAVLGVAD